MQIVINIPNEMYDWYDNGFPDEEDTEKLWQIVKNGIPLPKGHGRIMDVDKIIKKMEEREEQLKDDRSIWETAGVETALDIFGETIIEADTEGRVQNGKDGCSD